MQGCPLGLGAARPAAHGLPVPGEEAHGGPEASGERLPAAPGRRGGREGVRPVHPAAAPPVHPSAAQRLQHVAGYKIQTCRFLLPRSSPVFCFLLLSAPGDRAPDGKSLLSRSPCWEHPASFRPSTVPGAVPAAAPAAPCSCCSVSGWPGGGRGVEGAGVRAWQGQTLIPAGPLWVLCAGQPQLPIGWSRADPLAPPGREAAGTTGAPLGHSSPQPAKPAGHGNPHPAPSVSPVLALPPSPALWAPVLSPYQLRLTAHQCRAWAGNAGFPNNNWVLLPPTA